MSLTTRLTPLAVAALVAITGVGCGGDSDDPGSGKSVNLDPETSSTPSPSTPTKSAAAEALPTSYPEVGLEFAAFPTAQGSTLDALKTYVSFEQGLLKMVRTAKFNTQLTDNATEGALTLMRQTVDYLQKNNGRYKGTATIEVGKVDRSGRFVVLNTCEDSSKLTMTENGTAKPLEGRKRIPIEVVLTSFNDQWRVSEYTQEDGTC